MAERDLDAEAITKARLQLVLEYSGAIPVAAAAVCEDEETLGFRVASASFAAPSAGEGSDREYRRIVGCANKNMAAVARRLVKCPGDGGTDRISLEVVIVDRNRRAFPGASVILEAPQHLLLFGINAGHRPTLSCETPPHSADVLKLLVAKRAGCASELLMIDAQRELQPFEQARDSLRGHVEAGFAQLIADLLGRLVGPLEAAYRIACGVVFHHLLDRLDDLGSFFSSL